MLAAITANMVSITPSVAEATDSGMPVFLLEYFSHDVKYITPA